MVGANVNERVRYCVGCGIALSPLKPKGSKYCTKKCQGVHYRADDIRTRTENGTVSLPPGTVGALHEMVVSTDLMRRGYHVFRAISPSCPCDLVIHRDGGSSIRVEVKTGTRKVSDGSLVIPNLMHQVGERFDVLAVVAHDGEIVYEPFTP